MRSALGEPARDGDFRIICEDGTIVEGKVRLGEGARVELPDGRAVLESVLALPELPIGRHRLQVDGVDSVLTLAPCGVLQPEGRLAAPVRRLGTALCATTKRWRRRRSAD